MMSFFLFLSLTQTVLSLCPRTSFGIEIGLPRRVLQHGNVPYCTTNNQIEYPELKKFVGGYLSNCLVTKDGRVGCFGSNANGMLGIGLPFNDTASNRGDDPSELGKDFIYMDLPTNTKAIDVKTGRNSACILLNSQKITLLDEELKELVCVGYNYCGIFGTGSPDDVGESPEDMGDGLKSFSLPTGKTVMDFCVGSNVCVLTQDRNVYCNGSNLSGRLGISNAVNDRGSHERHVGNNQIPIDFGEGRVPKTLICGFNYTCVIFETSLDVLCWGRNVRGQLGDGSTTDTNVDLMPLASTTAVPLGGPVAQVSTMEGHVCVIMQNESRDLKCWGYNEYGQCGYPRSSNTNLGDEPNEIETLVVPVDLGHVVPGGTEKLVPREVDVGTNHTCVTFTNHPGLKCFGDNRYGQLGIGSTSDRYGGIKDEMGDNLPYVNIFSTEEELDGRWIKTVSVAFEQSCVVLDNFTVKCWGRHDWDGLLGLGTGTFTIGDTASDMGDNLPRLEVGCIVPNPQCPIGTRLGKRFIGEEPCVPCEENTFSFEENSITCSKCPEKTFSKPGSSKCDSCSIGKFNATLSECDALTNRKEIIYFSSNGICSEVLEADPFLDENESVFCGYVSMGSSSGIVVISFISTSSFICFMSLCGLLYWWDNPLIRASQKEVTAGFILGTLLVSTSFLTQLGENTRMLCALRSLTVNVSLIFMLVCLYAKEAKVYKLFKFTNVLSAANRLKTTMKALSLFAFGIVLCIIWMVVDRPVPVLQDVPSFKWNELYCDFENCGSTPQESICRSPYQVVEYIVYAYILVLIAMNCYISWKTRKVPNAISESRFINFAMSNILFMGIFLAFVTNLALETNYGSTALLLWAFGFAWCTSTSALLLMLPKFVVIVSNSREEITQHLKGSVQASGSVAKDTSQRTPAQYASMGGFGQERSTQSTLQTAHLTEEVFPEQGNRRAMFGSKLPKAYTLVLQGGVNSVEAKLVAPSSKKRTPNNISSTAEGEVANTALVRPPGL